MSQNFVFNGLYCLIAFFGGAVFGGFVTAGMIEILKKKGIIK